MKFSATLIAFVAAALAVQAAPTTPNKNLGGDQVNQNNWGDQVVRDSNNDVTDDGLLGGAMGEGGLLGGLPLTKRHGHGGYYYFPSNKNLGGDQVNQNGKGDQVVRNSNNRANQDGLLGGVLSKRNDNKNLGGDQVNQNTWGDQVVRDSNDDSTNDGLLSGLGLTKRHGHGGYYYFPSNKNLGGDQVNQNGKGDQVVRNSNNRADQGGLLSGVLRKRNDNKNLGGDQVNQNTWGDQVVRDSNNDSTDDGLLSGLGLTKRHGHGGYYYFPSNKNLGGDQVNQNGKGDQVVRNSNNRANQDGLLGGIVSKRSNKNLGGGQTNQNSGGDQVVRDSNNRNNQGGLIDGLGITL